MVVLKYDPTFAKPNTCFLLADGRTLRCRIIESKETGETIENYELQYRRHRPGALHLKQLTAEMDAWGIESSVVDKDVARVKLEIRGVPWWVADALKVL
jgi:hypothetical protein